jgi:hypothetical protein
MFKGALYKLRLTVARVLSEPLSVGESIPFPFDAPQVHVAGANPDRVLFFGSGPISGGGVDSHRSSIVGHAARQIAGLTGRGVDADVVADRTMSIAAARDLLQRTHPNRYDAIVIAAGLSDVMVATSNRRWAEGLSALLDTALDEAAVSCGIFLIGVGNPAASALFRSWRKPDAASRANAFNRISRKLAAERPRVTFLEFTLGQPQPGDRPYTSETHAHWASEIAGPIALALNRAAVSGAERAAYGIEAEPQRQAALERLAILDTEPEERFDRIVRMATVLFKAQTATFALIDNDREWFKSIVGLDLREVHRDVSFCTTTITERGGLEISDARSDPRFARNPYVTGPPRIRFYLGYPVESHDGYPIGALSVFDPRPRQAGANDMSVLRDLALLIQGELAH